MSRNYDNWERLVHATLDREKLRELALCPSMDTCSFRSSISSSSSFNFDFEFPSPLETGFSDSVSTLSNSFSSFQLHDNPVAAAADTKAAEASRGTLKPPLFSRIFTKKKSKTKSSTYKPDRHANAELELQANRDRWRPITLANAKIKIVEGRPVAKSEDCWVSSTVEILPMLKDVPLSDREEVFNQKLQICCFVFDFTDPMKFQAEKEIKRRTLAELIDWVESIRSYEMSKIMHEELIKMISVNIFRSLSAASNLHMNTGSEKFSGIKVDELDFLLDEREFEFMDASWPHLQLVYDLLLQYVVSTEPNLMCLNHIFLQKLLDLFDSKDKRERGCLMIILHRLYFTFKVHQPFLMNSISRIIYRFIFETERHNGISELLEILGRIISGLTVPLKDEHKEILVRALIPLHKPNCIASYHPHLLYCITQFVVKDHRLVDQVIRGILEYWPVTNYTKELLFLGEVEEILEVTQLAEFQQCVVPLFRQIARSLRSFDIRVAIRALLLWNNDRVHALIVENRRVILPLIFDALEKNTRSLRMPLIFDALEKNTRSLGNQEIIKLTNDVRSMFLERDNELFQECRRQHEEKRQ